MNGFTKGEFKAVFDEMWGCAGITAADGTDMTTRDISRDEDMANATLVAACVTSATKLAEQGYDAQAAMEALPEIVEAFAEYAAWAAEFDKDAALLSRIRPEVDHGDE